MGYTERKIWR